MQVLVVLEQPDSLPLDLPSVRLVPAREYLTSPELSDLRGAVVFNLCRSYGYQRIGYYVSLLADARGHRPHPSVETIQDIHSRTIVRLVSDRLGELIERSLSRLRSDEFVLSVYFGEPLAQRDRRLALALFNQFRAPLLRARFRRDREWSLRSIEPIPASEIPPHHHDAVIAAATRYFDRARWSSPRRRAPKAHLAILIDPNDPEPASDEKAIRKLVRAARHEGMAAETITKQDFGRIGEYDALFIRATTAVNHYTYRFARRAEAEGLVVIDDPLSIVRATNKVFLQELLRRRGVRTPNALVVHRGNRDRVGAELGFPVVLKKPDSAFSLGVTRAEDEAGLQRSLDHLLDESELVIAQEFLPTDYDWRVGVFEDWPLYACRYFMAPKHWQIMKHGATGGATRYGRVEAVPVDEVPERVLKAALRAAKPIGDGLYGVDVKEVRSRAFVMEVNDNPSLESGYEDRVLGDELYRRIMRGFLDRIERKRERWR